MIFFPLSCFAPLQTTHTSVYTHGIFCSADSSVVSKAADGILIVAVQAGGCRPRIQLNDVTTKTFITTLLEGQGKWHKEKIRLYSQFGAL